MSYVAGRVGMIPKGVWHEKTPYEKLDVVSYENKGYVAKVSDIPIGTLPTDSNYWVLMFDMTEYVGKNNPEFVGSVSSNVETLVTKITEEQIEHDISTAPMGIGLTKISDNEWRLSIEIPELVNFPIEHSEIILPYELSYNFSIKGELRSSSNSYDIRITFFGSDVVSIYRRSGGVIDIVGDVADVHVYLASTGEEVTSDGYFRMPPQNILSVSTSLKLIVVEKTDAINDSVSLGLGCTAIGEQSQSFGMGNKALSKNQMVIGRYNIEDTENKYAFIIGNGTDGLNRSNALAIKWDGTIVTSNF